MFWCGDIFGKSPKGCLTPTAETALGVDNWHGVVRQCTATALVENMQGISVG